MKKARAILATIIFTLILLVFLDSTGNSSRIFGFLPKIQLLPALLAGNVVIILVLALVTLLFGRIYCSVICPMGILQDIISHLRGSKASRRFSYKKENKWLRYGILVLFIILLIAGLNAMANLIAPYGAFGRIATNIFAPISDFFIKIFSLEDISLEKLSFKDFSLDKFSSLKIFSTGIGIIALITFIVIAIAAWINGRIYCNTICPVGTILGFLSRYAIFRPMIDLEKCRNCHVCERKCKSSCIDIKNKHIDYSRCVSCLNCIDNCKFGAISYRFAYKSKTGTKPSKQTCSPINKHAQVDFNKEETLKVNISRRAFITSSCIAASSFALEANGGLLKKTKEKQNPKRSTPITPAGAISNDSFYSKCVACQLCVIHCPQDILTPSLRLEHFMQPEMNYLNGFCQPDCVKCSEVCPAGAIISITPSEKPKYHLGLASVDYSSCYKCGICARVCPQRAIEMLPPNQAKSNTQVTKDNNSKNKNKTAKKGHVRKIPVVSPEKCIGCGACENACPVKPISAITIDGNRGVKLT